MTKTRVERLLEQAKDDEDAGEGGEFRVEVAGVPNEDSPPSASDPEELPWLEMATVSTGEVSTPDAPDPEDLDRCEVGDCPNPVLPEEPGLSDLDRCEACLGMPERDWRPVVRENEEGEGA